MRQFEGKHRKRAKTEVTPLDPIALTLALWLGIVVGVTGLMRLSETAAANAAARMQQDGQRAAMTTIRPAAMLLAPYGS